MIDLLEAPMARKKAEKTPESSSALTTVKVEKLIHARLKIVSQVEGVDVAPLITQLLGASLEKRYKAAVAKLAES